MGRTTHKYIGLSLLSACVLALEVILTRIFSITIWYHFAYLVIGLALLSSGAAAVILAVLRWNTETIARRIGKVTFGFSVSILLTLLVIAAVGIDPLGGRSALLLALLGLAIYFVALFATFFLGGLAISCAFRLWSQSVHRLYFADMFGASISALAVVWIIQAIGGPAAIAFTAIIAGLAGLILSQELSGVWKNLTRLVLLGQAGLLMLILVNPIQLPIPQSKELSWVLQVAGTQTPEYTRWNPVARVDVLPPTEFNQSNSWVIFGGLSSAYWAQPNPAQYPIRFVTLDGTSITALHSSDGDVSRFRFLEHALASAPYQIGLVRPNTLNIGVGGGLDIDMAHVFGAENVTAIELNSDVVDLLKGRYADFTGHIAETPGTTLVAAEGRSFLMRDESHYDIIQGIGVDNFAALSGGAYVLSESYLYTVDALRLVLDRLTPHGVFSWTRNVNDPPREMLRLTGLAAHALRQRGIVNPAEHIAIVANEPINVATILVSPAPFTDAAVQKLRAWADLNHFVILQDSLTRLSTVYADYLNAPDPRAFEAAYPFNISPVTDDNPFFYNYFKWSNLWVNGGDSGDVNTRVPVGNFVLLAMLSFSIISAVLFILIPLLRYQRVGLKTPHAGPMLSYFALLGMGYILVEIVLIQHFTLFIGYPTRAVTTTIFSMLVFSAVGSLIAQRVCTTPGRLRVAMMALVALMLIYVVLLPSVLDALLRLPDGARTLLSVALIAPLAMLMGMPFPTGLNRLSIQSPDLIPWAWGVNGVFSVLGSVLVIVISMQIGFAAALVIAASMYTIAAGLLGAVSKTRLVDSHSAAAAHLANSEVTGR